MLSQAASLVLSWLLEGPHVECRDREKSPEPPVYAGRCPSLGHVSAGTPPSVPPIRARLPESPSYVAFVQCRPRNGLRQNTLTAPVTRRRWQSPPGPGRGGTGRSPGLRPRPLAFLRSVLGFFTH